jgi:hypothetical protein
LKKYIGEKNKQFEWFEKEKNFNKSYLEMKDYNQTEDSKNRFKPSWRQVLPQRYGRVNENVIYQKGDLLE